MHRLVALVPLALTLACSSPCQDLATRICECQPSGNSRDNCQRAVEDQIDGGNPRPGQAQQDFCEATLRTCPDPSDDPAACEALDTPEGKAACGLAYPTE